MMSKTGYPVTQQELAPLLPAPLISQELETGKRHFEIPDKVMDVYMDWRPTPLVRAERLERMLDTPRSCTSSLKVAARPAHMNRTPPFRRPTL